MLLASRCSSDCTAGTLELTRGVVARMVANTAVKIVFFISLAFLTTCSIGCGDFLERFENRKGVLRKIERVMTMSAGCASLKAYG